MSKSTKQLKVLDDPYLVLSLVISLVLALLVLSFKNYFFFLPVFAGSNNLISLFQIFSTFGWVTLIVFPPVFMYRVVDWNRKTSVVFLALVLLWPISTIIIKILSFITWNVWLVSYLSTYPVFFFMDFFAPLIYVLVWNYKKSQVD
jgi:hypothetical protein